ncbi:MAG: hypothetical protein AAGC88_01880, partial [Bacteroidota bacterium]
FPEVFPGVHEDPTHGWKGILDNATEEGTIRTAIAFRLWYHSGAAANHLLQLVGVELEKAYMAFQTPYELGRDFVNLDENALLELQNEITSQIYWPDYEKRASELMLIMGN